MPTRSNEFSGSLKFADIENHATYSGEGFGIGIQGTIAGNGNNQNSHLINVADKNSLSHDGIGYGHDSDNQHSITKSGINTANISIRDNEKQQALTGKSVEETIQAVKTDITLENGRLKFQVQHFKCSKKTSLGVRQPNAFGFAETSFSWSVVKFILNGF